KFNQFLLNQVAAVVSVSEASRKDFHRTFRFPERKSVAIPIGIVPGEIELMLHEEGMDVNLTSPYIIQIGGWVQEKDPLGMLGIFKEVLKSRPGLQLVFLGSGPLESR